MRIPEKNQKLIVLILLLLAGFYFLYVVRGILFPFLIASVIAYVVNPLIEKLLARGFSRIGAIVLLFGMILTIFLIIIVFGLPLIVEELNRLSQTLPSYIRVLQEYIDQFSTDLQRIKFPAIVKQLADQTLQRAEEVGLGLINWLSELILNIFSHVVGLIIAPIIAFYILKDLESLSDSVNGWIPVRYWDQVYRLGLEINAVISGFLRGQFLVAILIAFLTTIGLLFLRVNFAIVLGIIAGAFNIIPYLGPILGAVPTIVIVLVHSPLKALAVSALFLIIQQIEGGIISPRIMSNQVGLSPLTVIFAILAGGELAGLLGMILAVPIVGIIKVILKFILDKLPS